MAELGAWVEAGPDPARDGVVRWRRQDLQRPIATAFGIELHERPVGKDVGKYLASLGYRRLSLRPQHPKSDPGAQAAFKKTSDRLTRRGDCGRRGAALYCRTTRAALPALHAGWQAPTRQGRQNGRKKGSLSSCQTLLDQHLQRPFRR
jgi:hypothetical protein